MIERNPASDDRFLILAPTGRDAPLTCALLERDAFECRTCADMDELCDRFERDGAMGLLIAEEVLVKRSFERLAQTLARQESWSDVPILLFTSTTASLGNRRQSAASLAPLGSVTLLERPVRPITMLSAATAAMRARRRQYLARGELLAQQRAVKQRDEFLAMLGHELRNPLAAISLANELEGEPHELRRRDVIGRQVKHLTRLVDDLLDVSRVTSGKIALQCETVDLCEIADAAMRLVGSTIDTRQVSLQHVKPDGRMMVRGDPVRLEQIIVNLLVNAIKYSSARGRIELRLTVEGEDALVQVQDWGIGIAQEMLERVFDLFVQADAGIDRANGGLGIGLTLVRSLVELHGGKVEAESPGPARGSTFRVRLPLAQSEVTAADSGVHPIGRAPRHDVLVIEDNPDSRELMVLILERMGHRVHSAEDGPTGVREALTRRPDVLLVDIGLPGLDGYDVARQVRSELGADVYLIALTGYGQPDDRRRAFDAGFDAHFTKPLDVHAIDHILNQAKPQSATG